MIKIAINGFGRIGRNAFKVALETKNIKVVAINDLTDIKTLAYLLQYDTVYGQYWNEVDYDENNIIVNGKKFPVFSRRDPAKLPWGKHKVDIVLECTGVFTAKEKSLPHIDQAGAKHVLISAPSKEGKVKTLILGVNENKYKANDKIVSNGSCTTNAIAPIVNILENKIGIKKCFLTTVHAYTANQNLVDGPSSKDLRRGRAAAYNTVPTTTGAAKAVVRAIPKLKGKFDGIAIRVPVLCGSLIDFSIVLKKKSSVQEINKLFIKSALGKKLNGIIGVVKDPLVSSDVIGTTESAIVDLLSTRVIKNDLLKLLVWYDNEWAYCCRLVESAHLWGSIIKADKK